MPQRLRPSTLRARLVVLVGGTALVCCLGIGLVAFVQARRGLEQLAFRAVGAVADSRRESLLLSIRRERQRAGNVLAALVAQCGAAKEPEACAAPGLEAYRRTEGALAVEISLSPAPEPAALDREGVLARFVSTPKGRGLRMTVRAKDGSAALSVTAPIAPLQGMFADRAGLGASGETFLADEEGWFVTTPRYEAHSVLSHPVDSRPMLRCLAGESDEMRAADYRGVAVVHGFRALPELGGACIMAHLAEPEAFEAVSGLRQRMLVATLGFLGVALVLALWAARAIVRPLQALTDSAEAIEQGSFEVPKEMGPAETRTLARAFARTVSSLRSALSSEQAARDDAESALRARDEFLSIAGHELRTPLTSLRLQIQLLGRTQGLPREMAERIERQVGRLTALVDQLLDVSRITTGQLSLSRERIDAAAVVRDVAGRFSELAVRAGCTLSVAADDEIRGSFDAARLDQVVTNLIANALKYGAGSPVHVEAGAIDGQLRIVVADRGIGVPPHDRARIFQRFERAVSSRQYGGLGLGLWIARQIVEAHGGRISVRDQPGGGALFEVLIPRA